MSQPIRILFVDDEERILRSLALQFRRDYEVLIESDPLRALERLRHEKVQVIVSDQRMSQMNGAELLAQARELQPDAMRILLTGYSDLEAAIEALNSGGIFRYLTKPWDPQEMAVTLRQAAQIALSKQQLAVLPGLPPAPQALNVLLLDEAEETFDCVGAFCMTGAHAGIEANSTLIEDVREAIKSRGVPVFAATGCRRDNIKQKLDISDGALVGTTFKVDGVFENHIDPQRVKDFMEVVAEYRKEHND